MSYLLRGKGDNVQIFMTKPRIITKSWSYVTSILAQSFPRNMSYKAADGKDGGVKAKPTSTSRVSSPEKNASSSSASVKTAVNNDESNKIQEKSNERRVTRQSIHKQEEISQRKDKYLSMDLESKRKLYKGKHVTLESIKTWTEYFTQDLKQRSQGALLEKEKPKEARPDLNKKISLFQGDITSLEIDAIVNAANESLLGGGGVDGAIHRAAGPYLRSECETLHGCEPGDAKITCGYNLPAKYIIHTVGPRGENPQVLNQCYKHCLELVKEHKLSSVAFPCISTGIFGYPNVHAAKVALGTVRQWLEKDEYANNMERIILCLFLKVDVEAYEQLMTIYFPVTGSNVNKSSCAIVPSTRHRLN